MPISNTALLMDDAEDLLWDDLLEHIEDRRVIPIIGQELLEVGPPDARVPLYSWIAVRLAERLKLPLDGLGEQPTLNDVVCRYLSERRGRKEDIYPKIRLILKDEDFPAPEALRKLVAMDCFNLFVSVTFDSMLQRAIDEVRHGGKPQTDVFSYSPNNFEDIKSEKNDLKNPTVFHLLGKLSASPDYVINEEDILEFIYSMLSDTRRPQNLFDELKNNHLLILGCTFSGWLARFFIRAAKSQQLSSNRGEIEVFVGNNLADDNSLVLFLQNFSYNTKILSYSPKQFVNELAERWARRNPPPGPPSGEIHIVPPPPPADSSMPAGSIFISYASQDAEAARKLQEMLTAANLDAWLDKQALEGGDDYALKIRRNIKSCSCFLPLISQASTQRKEGFFICEWKWALERAASIADGIPFIIPVVIDETDPYCQNVPEQFQQVHWTSAPGGAVPPNFTQRLIQVVREYHKRMRG